MKVSMLIDATAVHAVLVHRDAHIVHEVTYIVAFYDHLI
jgi:hypothetical protein